MNSDTREAASWEIFARTNRPDIDGQLKLKLLPPPPPWRAFGRDLKPTEPDEFALAVSEVDLERGRNFICSHELAEAVNAALYLRRPLFLTGKPGTGKSTLVYAVARELRLGPVLRWPVTSRSTLREGMYQYDALGRLNEQSPNAPAGSPEDIGRFVELGPLGTALYPTDWPRALLIDEIDKGDLDFPNDLLNTFEEGEVTLIELARSATDIINVRLWGSRRAVPIHHGKFVCRQFPFVVLTSNGERTFPAPFLRRCIQFTIPDPSPQELEKIVVARFGMLADDATKLIDEFLNRREKGEVATDQLLNAIYLMSGAEYNIPGPSRDRLREMLLKKLSSIEP